MSLIYGIYKDEWSGIEVSDNHLSAPGTALAITAYDNGEGACIDLTMEQLKGLQAFFTKFIEENGGEVNGN